jgi:hypothetical protein
MPFSLPGKPFGSTAQIAYQAGGIATVAYLEVTSLSPLETSLHVGVIAPGGAYQEQLQLVSTPSSVPADVKLAVAPNGAAVLEWTVLKGSEPATAPLEYLASYRAAGSGTWGAPTTVATDTTRMSGISDRLVPAVGSDGTAAAGVEHLDPTIASPGGYRIDVAVAPASGSWGPAVQVSPPSDSSEGLALGFDAGGDLTAAFRLEMSNTRHTLAAKRRPASSGIWGSLEDVTGSDVTSDVFGPALAVGADGSAIIGFQYVHYAGSKTLDVNAVTRLGATGSWSAPLDVAPGGASSGPLATGVAPDDVTYVLYTLQGTSSGEDCIGVVRAYAGNDYFTSPQCVSPINFQSGYAGGVAFLGNDAYFAWSGQPNGGKPSVVEDSRWVEGMSQPDSFTDLDTPAEGLVFDQLVADQDGSMAVFWSVGGGLRAAAFDGGGPNLLAAGVPTSGVAGQPVAMSASFVDLWSAIVEPPTWNFGDGTGGSGGKVSHTYPAPGSYTVTVTARDALGNPTSSAYPIAIAETPHSLPIVRVLSVLASKVVGQGILVRLSCTGTTGADCTGEAALRAREKLRSGKVVAVQAGRSRARTTSRTVVVGTTRFTLATGKTSSVSVALDASGRRLLARFGRLPVTLTVATTTTVLTKRFTISPPKHHAKHKKH